MTTYLCFIYNILYKTLFYFDVPHAVDVAILWTRFFIFTFRRQGFWFRRSFYRQRFRRRRRGRFRFSFRLRFGRVFLNSRFRFVFLRQSVQFSAFGE